jgi:hypothetical protein
MRPNSKAFRPTMTPRKMAMIRIASMLAPLRLGCCFLASGFSGQCSVEQGLPLAAETA